MQENQYSCNFCFPVQTGLFEDIQEEAFIDWDYLFVDENFPKWRISKDFIFLPSIDDSEIIITGYGCKLSKKSERLCIKDSDKIVYEIPFFKLSRINIQSRGVSISSDLIEECAKRGISLNFCSFNGIPQASLFSPLMNATIKTKRKQLEAYNTRKGVEFSKKIIFGKLRNQAALIKYFAKNREADFDTSVEKIIKLAKESLSIEGEKIDLVRNKLLAIEGLAAKEYWQCFGKLLLRYGGDDFRRDANSTSSPVNSLLNYGYGMLYSLVWNAVVSAGLEPFAGFLHVDRPGKPSLVLDLIEEFRAPLIDRIVMSFINLNSEVKIENGLLSAITRKSFSEKVLECFESKQYYKRKKYFIKSIIYIQARDVASFFREDKPYQSFIFKW